MRRSLAIAIVMFCVVTVTFAQLKVRTRTAAELAALQRQLVGGYCRSDFDGQRLTNEGWDKMKSFVRDRGNREFAVINIVSRYTFQPSETISINVPVTYNVIGKYDFAYGYAPASGTQTEMFRAEEKDGQLVITDAPAMPYVSKRAMVQWLRNELANAKNDSQKAQIEQAIKALEGAPAPADVAK